LALQKCGRWLLKLGRIFGSLFLSRPLKKLVRAIQIALQVFSGAARLYPGRSVFVKYFNSIYVLSVNFIISAMRARGPQGGASGLCRNKIFVGKFGCYFLAAQRYIKAKRLAGRRKFSLPRGIAWVLFKKQRAGQSGVAAADWLLMACGFSLFSAAAGVFFSSAVEFFKIFWRTRGKKLSFMYLIRAAFSLNNLFVQYKCARQYKMRGGSKRACVVGGAGAVAFFCAASVIFKRQVASSNKQAAVFKKKIGQYLMYEPGRGLISSPAAPRGNWLHRRALEARFSDEFYKLFGLKCAVSYVNVYDFFKNRSDSINYFQNIDKIISTNFLTGGEEVWRRRYIKELVVTLYSGIFSRAPAAIAEVLAFGLKKENKGHIRLLERVEAIVNSFNYISLNSATGIRIKVSGRVNANDRAGAYIINSKNLVPALRKSWLQVWYHSRQVFARYGIVHVHV
jgi:hypothetical protein